MLRNFKAVILRQCKFALPFSLVILLNNLKQKYINSAVLLLSASVIVKIISALYKIPLTAFIGATGRGYFNTAYTLFMPMHAVIMGALPVALTHLISKYREKNDSEKIYKLKKGASLLFFLLGAAGMALMLLFARPYAQAIASQKSIPAIFAMAPAVLFSAAAALNRAFAEGHMDMVPTSAGQVIEAVFKTVFGLLFSKYVMGVLYSSYLETGAVLGTVCSSEQQALSCIYPYTAAAAVAGASVGAFLCWVYCSAYVRLKYSSRYPRVKGAVLPEMRELVSFSLPIVVSTIIQSVSSFLDNASIQLCLSLCDLEQLAAAYSQSLSISGTESGDIPAYIYGLFSSANDLKMLFPGFTMALGVAAVPALTCAYETGRRVQLSALINSIFKYTSVIAIGGGFYLSLCAEYLLQFLYGSSNYDIVIGCYGLVRLYGFTMLLFCLSGTVVFSVQAIGCASKSIPSFIAAAVLRIALNFALVSNAKINIYGAALSDIAGYAVILACNFHIISKYAGVKFRFGTMVLKPLCCSGAAYAAAYFAFDSLFDFSNATADFVVLSMIYAVIFAILVIMSKTVRLSELNVLRNCKKMA